MFEVIMAAKPLFLSILAVSGLNWILPQIYVYLCIPDGVSGFLLSMITTASPICQGILNLMTHSVTVYTGLIGTALGIIISNYFRAKGDDTNNTN
jgi:hypothetical protein